MLTSHIIRVAVEAALAEDAPYGDITCETTIPADETGSAHLTARGHGGDWLAVVGAGVKTA